MPKFAVLFCSAVIILLYGARVYGQQYNTLDSIQSVQKSSQTKKSKKHYDDRGRVYKWLFRRETGPRVVQNIDCEPFKELQGKTVIRHIIIESKEPFGYSVFDTSKKPKSLLEKAGNAVHVKSKRMAINKFILFKEGQKVDTIRIQETARLLRQQKYVRDVNIIPMAVEGGESVDILIKELDSWTILPRGSFSSSHFKIGLRERNFIGMGHEAQLSYAKRMSDGETGFGAKYMIPNIANSFIDVTGNYYSSFDNFQDKYISVKRDFYSPLARWAGSIFFQERLLERPFIAPDYSVENHNLKFYYQDYWLARAFPINRDNTKDDIQENVIIGLRAALVNYRDTLPVAVDQTRFFSNEQFYLGSVSLASRKYVTDHHIFNDGRTEDVPTGGLYTLTSGIQRKNHRSRLYMGVQATKGEYFDWGFLSASAGIGTFFGKRHTEQTTISLKANYFSNLIELGQEGWKMRQFIKPQIVIGIDRQYSFNDRLGLNERPYFRGVNSYEYIDYAAQQRFIDYQNGNMQGFDSPVIGTRKYVVDLLTQFYSPWELMGFRFNPFASATLSVLTGGDKSYGSNRLYSSFSLGFVIRNDFFVFDSFQLSLSFYPSMPGRGKNIIKANSFRNDNFGFQDFKSDEPRPIIYE